MVPYETLRFVIYEYKENEFECPSRLLREQLWGFSGQEWIGMTIKKCAEDSVVLRSEKIRKGKLLLLICHVLLKLLINITRNKKRITSNCRAIYPD